MSEGNRWGDDAAEDEPSPYQPPASHPDPIPRISRDPSVFEEPWMKAATPPQEALEAPLVPTDSEADAAESSVWDEPVTSEGLIGDTSADRVTWMRWYQKQAASTSRETTWYVTLVVAALSGLLAVVGALLVTPQVWFAVVVAGPITEEILKIALPIWVVEKRPWLFASRWQILLCGAFAGLVFATLENFLYLNVYISNPGLAITTWRWTVCVALHVGCSLIAAAGVARVWECFQAQQRRPQLTDGASLITTAMGDSRRLQPARRAVRIHPRRLLSKAADEVSPTLVDLSELALANHRPSLRRRVD